VTDFLEGEGQHAFVGFTAGTNDFLNVWRPVNYAPGAPTNLPVVRFSVLMTVEDSSSTTNRDDFRWSLYNAREDRLFSLDFDNHSLGINYLLDDDEFVATGRTFTNSFPYQLEVEMNFQRNLWSATLNGQGLVTNLPITSQNLPLDFGDMDAVWAIRTPGQPGDNFMVFDKYRLVAEAEDTGMPPRLEVLGAFAEPGPQVRFLLRGFGVAGLNYVVQATTNLTAWFPLKTNTVSADGYFDHSDLSASPFRFYRLIQQ
jgi:hypothetical protein